MDVDAFLARAKSALNMPTTYFLDFGAWARSQAATPQPGTPVDLRAELKTMAKARPDVHAEYLGAIDEHHIDLDAMPPQACDCTNFLCWALGVARDSGPWPANNGRINTTNIIADATGAQTLFVVRKNEPERVGDILVYAAGAFKGAKVGHAGIVTAVEGGRTTRVLHCAPENYLLTPPAGLPRNAIAETPTERFDAARPRNLHVVWCKGLEG